MTKENEQLSHAVYTASSDALSYGVGFVVVTNVDGNLQYSQVPIEEYEEFAEQIKWYAKNNPKPKFN